MTTSAEITGAVLSLGSINADFQVRVERRPEISETLIGHEFERLGGGKAANVAYCARRLGVSTQLFGHVGEDDLAEQALAPLRKLGVELSDVAWVKGEATGVAMITVPPDGDKGIVLATNANEVWSAADADQLAQAIGACPEQSVLVVDCEVPALVVNRAVEAAKQRACRVILDPSPAERVSDDLIAAADLITPNAAEAEQLLGSASRDIDSALQAGMALVNKGAGAACMKLPEGGCVLVEKNRAIHIGVVDVEVVDTTGAGDAFAGSLAVALIKGFPQTEAAKFAVAASHLVVSAYGSQPALPSWGEVERMARRLPVSVISGTAQ